MIDPFAAVQEQTRRHRADHGCGAYTYADGSLLGVVAATTGARRIVEVGTALGYTALWLAHGAPDATVDTIEMDPGHAELAREIFHERGLGDRITVHDGVAEAILPALRSAAYDVAFFDGFAPTAEVVSDLRRLLRSGGVLVAGNLTLAADRVVERELADSGRWLTHNFGETALAVRQAST